MYNKLHMEFDHHVEKKDMSLFKKLERFVSSSNYTRPKCSTRSSTFRKSRSWHSCSSSSNRKEKAKVTPNGCFSVCVGEEKKRFVIKIEYANHPLFKMLLEDAELEYGFNNEGPLLLPCEVDLFCKVLSEMDSCGKEFDENWYLPRGSCSPFSPAMRRLAKGCSSYGLLTPPPRAIPQD